MRPTRSLLFVPGNRQKLLDKAPTLPADALILDLEDSVPVAEKPNARAIVRDYIPTLIGKGKGVWVRVNGLTTEFLGGDLGALVGLDGLDGVVLPKPESADDIRQVDEMMTKLERERGVPIDKTEVIVQIESAPGVIFAYQIATAAKRIATLVFGGAQDADLQTDLGCAWSVDGPVEPGLQLHQHRDLLARLGRPGEGAHHRRVTRRTVERHLDRQHVLVACRAARLLYPLDGVFANYNDDEGYARDTELSRRLGYRGRTAIHPKQIEPANRLYSPTPEEVAYYRRVLEAFEAAVAQGSASTTIDGKMIDYAMAANARRVIALADAIGAAAQ